MNKQLYKIEVGTADGVIGAEFLAEGEAPSIAAESVFKHLAQNAFYGVEVHEGMRVQCNGMNPGEETFYANSRYVHLGQLPVMIGYRAPQGFEGVAVVTHTIPSEAQAA